MKPGVSRLFLMRRQHGITQDELAEKVEYSQVMISLIENGLHPSGELARKISKALKCEVQDIFPVFLPDQDVIKMLYGGKFRWPWEIEEK